MLRFTVFFLLRRLSSINDVTQAIYIKKKKKAVRVSLEVSAVRKSIRNYSAEGKACWCIESYLLGPLHCGFPMPSLGFHLTDCTSGLKKF